MIYQSDALTVQRLEGDIAELYFDLTGRIGQQIRPRHRRPA